MCTSATPLRCVSGVGADNPCILVMLVCKNKAKPRKDGSTGRSKRKRHTPAHRLRESDLRILEVNIRGLRSNIGELTNLCTEKKPSVVIVVETFLDPTVPDGADCIAIPGYSLCCRRDRTVKSRGGIAVYCLEGIAIHHDTTQDPTDLELIWFTIALHSQKLLIAAVYRPPDANSDIISYLDSNTLQTMRKFGANSVMLIGDFNVHHIDWLGSHVTDAAGRRTLQLANSLGLQQIVKEPTREDQILDLVMTDLTATSSTYARLGTSDHNPVLVCLEVPVYRDKPYQRNVWRYDQADYWGMRGHLASTDWPSVFQKKDPEIACSKVTEIICDAMDLFIPSKTVTKKIGDKAWFDDTCRRAARKKRRLFQKSKKDKNDTSKAKFAEARKSFNQAEKQARTRYNNKLREDLTDKTLSSKKWWRIVNTLSGRTARSDIPVIEHQNIAHITARDKAEIFCKTFAEKCCLQGAEDQAPDVSRSTTKSINKVTFKPKDVRKLLQHVKSDKATGPDQIPTRVLRECSAELTSPLCRLFDLCLSNGVFPSQWKTASVTPIHKRDSKADPTKYRPISLLSNISKIMEAAVQKQLQRYLLSNNLISSRQFGFKPGHSTADLLNILSQKWNNSLDQSDEVCVIALDIKGAFDKVWHNGLCSKLRAKGVSGVLLTWIHNYLSDRSINVVLSGQSSDTASINASVPQGSILGPLLFSVFIDDLVDVCENELFLYADDSTLFAPIKKSDDINTAAASLNRDLNNMKVWAQKWKVTFEPTKCKTMVLSRKRTPSKLDLYFGDCRLPIVNDLDILGVTIDSKLTWSKHLSTISTRAGQKLGALRKVANKLDSEGRATVYKSQVRSVMEYASLSWINASPTILAQLDNIQKKALKVIGVDEATALSRLNITSLLHRRRVAATTVLYKMHTSHCPVDLAALLPPPYIRRRATRSSVSMPDHALSLPAARTRCLDRSFIHTAVPLWNSLPESIVGNITAEGIQSFKCRVHEHLLTT